MLSNAVNADAANAKPLPRKPKKGNHWPNEVRREEMVQQKGKNFAFYRFLELPRPMAGS